MKTEDQAALVAGAQMDKLHAAAPELLDALQSLWGYVEDLRQSNPGYLGKLVLQDYGKMNEAFIKTARVLKKLQ